MSPIPRSDQAEVIEWNDGDLAEWCDECGMGHRKNFCPKVRSGACRQRLAVDTDGYIRTMWDRLLDNELEI